MAGFAVFAENEGAMELKLEGIVETLLVGAMVSLWMLSIIFFAFGHIWNVPVMRRFFDTLFGERQNSPDANERPGVHKDEASDAVPEERKESGHASASHKVVRKAKKEESGSGEAPMNFALILLLALLYGLGVIAESGSHIFLHNDNSDEKHKSFQTVALGQLRSGTATPRLARFISDYDACRTMPRRKLKKGEPPPLCEQIDDRVLEFFHNAKNAVFQNREFYEELSVLESRINFMRSFQTLALLLFCEMSLVFLIAVIAEYGSKKHEGVWARWMTKLFSEQGWRKGAIELGRHWVNIAAFHILLLLVGCVGLYALSRYACGYSEDQFALRVFGYYLALAPAHGEGAEGGEHERGGTSRDMTPESPYHMFSLSEDEGDGPPGASLQAGAPRPPGGGGQSSGDESPGLPGTAEAPEHGAHNQRRLEPSAVQILGNSARVLIASDQGGGEPFWLFTLNEDGTRLEHPEPIHVEPNDQETIKRVGAIESLAAFESGPQDASWAGLDTCTAHGDHKTFKVFAGPNAFGLETGPGKGKPAPALLSFCLEADRSPLRIDKIEEQPITSPCDVLDHAESCAVEGIAFRIDEKGQPELLLGIQKAGASSTVAIVRMRRNKGTWGSAERIFPRKDDQCSADSNIGAMLNGGAGISDLASAPSGRVYVTTSMQRDGSSAGAWGDRGMTAAAPQVGGALWLVDLGCDAKKAGDPCRCSAQRATLLETFIHKPDGVTHDNGSVLIVFDDEARRKSRQWAPKTFPLAQNEAVFAVVPSPEFR